MFDEFSFTNKRSQKRLQKVKKIHRVKKAFKKNRNTDNYYKFEAKESMNFEEEEAFLDDFYEDDYDYDYDYDNCSCCGDFYCFDKTTFLNLNISKYVNEYRNLNLIKMNSDEKYDLNKLFEFGNAFVFKMD